MFTVKATFNDHKNPLYYGSDNYLKIFGPFDSRAEAQRTVTVLAGQPSCQNAIVVTEEDND